MKLLLSRCCPPDVVLFPRCVEEVSALAKVCYKNNIPMIPVGTGTGLEGGVNAVKVKKGNICIIYVYVSSYMLVNYDDKCQMMAFLYMAEPRQVGFTFMCYRSFAFDL